MTIEQLQELIIKHDHIHIFHSIIDLVLSMHKEQHQTFLCHVYIDPSYYTTIPNTIPLSQSQLVADNMNLNQVLHSIERMAILLGIKFDQPTPRILLEKISAEKRKSILHQQSLYIASKIPSHYTSIHI